ncbi:MAG: tRNA preQ1(34) S-adenosylmethionine ribosyltransferase-isomerase QueA [Coriobacteriaceae bacterium]|jgi:S-adenosylmethionine:tRNA ribosyltransferase-isomerase|nr:tRNA preQ1(34) S-adenosylmethionine ribosyltransferase-isomerase QueA [Coriobacteriaceae bacterium]
MRTSDFDYHLPESCIAQSPWPVRDECKLLAMDRSTGALVDCLFHDIYDYLDPGDLLVANETRVLPARLLGTKRGSGGKAEVFLLREAPDRSTHASGISALWEVLVRPGKRLKPGAVIEFAAKDAIPGSAPPALVAEIVDWVDNGEKGARLARLGTLTHPTLQDALHAAGHTPLPPYIRHYSGDEEMYQTVFSRREGSAAAPTAGLHFTPGLIRRIEEKGVRFEKIELEVGLDTFRTIDEEDPALHHIHTEYHTVPQKVVDAIQETRARGKRVVAVGTTSVRSLESSWDERLGAPRARNREATSLYILPGYRFRVVDALITNFHVPRSTLLMLVSAFSSQEHLMAAYAHALRSDYRFLSFGDAMYIGEGIG